MSALITEILTGLKGVTLDSKASPVSGGDKVILYRMPKKKGQKEEKHIEIKFEKS